jgi:hypothetical protein
MTAQREAVVGTVSRLADANLFETTGPIVISYAATSFAGEPQFSYADAERTLSFSGAEITRVDVVGGELVTVTIEEVIDAFVRTFSVLVPRITVARGEQVEFDAVGIETVDRSQAFVPAPGPAGVLQTYRVHDLHGVAQAVSF